MRFKTQIKKGDWVALGADTSSQEQSNSTQNYGAAISFVSIPFNLEKITFQNFPVTFKPVAVYCRLIAELQIGGEGLYQTDQYYGFTPECVRMVHPIRTCHSSNITQATRDYSIGHDFDYGDSIPNSTINPYNLPANLPAGYYGVFQDRVLYMYRFNLNENKSTDVESALQQMGFRHNVTYGSYTDNQNIKYIFCFVEVHKNAIHFFPQEKAINTNIKMEDVCSLYFNSRRRNDILELSNCDPKI
ncbi:hypothetical protein DFA_10090 [Cavenderia fasciculata]|uniref:Monalysin Pore-forming domain-containing protein n=1 Tax=Cavenderia fasciculata TaxID=261658 RepID=F4Q987_CACFS|nr:uncharacterized protein DFA_10090 [Cavenderia fasciculata]EGG15256.1 hypothetical protein DFA_10090 [Cavenderia fasciculata]|eukprot:XP_004351976.1 hypothetical protein DFA_10090 [Cavenderia fasciculata]